MKILNKILLMSIGILLMNCSKDKKMFQLIDSEVSGIEFSNKITEKDTLNILDTEFVYNGGGVAVGDLNQDGLQDIYFCGNQVENKLYLNQKDFHFKDITSISKTNKKPNSWSSGVSILDINNDGKLDIYVNNTMSPDTLLRENLLFINQGNNADKIPIFKELAKEYGLNDDSQKSNTAFFDYDNDGDLDAFVAVNFIDQVFPNQYISRASDGSAPTRDRLYRNDFDKNLGHGVYTDVSIKAGIVWAGYSHSVLTHDFNQDGFQDIYVANDYLSNDLIYINNQDGTFTNQIKEIFKHQSNSAMGSDVADIDNDGLMDFISMEMLPFENKRKKLMQGANNYTSYLYNKEYKYEYQYVRNTLQLNRGLSPDTKLPVFSDISFFANVEATDWSWSPLLADFDNDGYRDLLVTNGFPKDVTDNDFGAFRNSISSTLTSVQDMNDMMPEVKTPNFIFKNNGDYTFSDKSKDWGIDLKSFTNGTAYADFDNDGDLDIITNNINDKAFLLENTVITKSVKSDSTNYIRIKLNGSPQNKSSISSQVAIYYNNKIQFAETNSCRGYLSSSEEFIHFGIGKSTKIDSLVIHWQNGNKQTVLNPKINELNIFNFDDSKSFSFNDVNDNSFLQYVDNKSIRLEHIFIENDFIDYNLQKTLPHKFSQNGPALAIGDINGDGLEDIVSGGSSRFEGFAFIQNSNGKFSEKEFNFKKGNKKEEDLGIVLFDADADGDNDMYIVRGSYQHPLKDSLYKDIFCVNDGKGNFTVSSSSIPLILANGQAVKAVDFDQDGDLDLFVGGRVLPKSYPKTDNSYFLRNETKQKDKPIFVDATAKVCAEISTIGMVSDVLFTDFDNDNQQDLIVAGEWMPLTFFKNVNGKFKNITQQTGIQKYIGWWNSLAPIDFDNDGDMDYVAGNYGKNLYFNCNEAEPMSIYAKDFDENGSFDPFISCYIRDSTGKKNEYFFNSKDDMQKQLILIRKKFEKYSDFGKAKVSDVFTNEEMKGVMKLQANYFESSLIINEGNGKFKLQKLPNKTQFAPIFGINTADVNQDGFEDILLVGNDYGMEIYQGRADAFYGQVLINNQKGGFNTTEISKSGFYAPGDSRALVRINIKNEEHFLVSQNMESLKISKSKKNDIRKIAQNEISGVITLKDGKKKKIEFNFGNSFLSQNGRFINFNESMQEISIFDVKGKLLRKILPTIL